ncbi:hypothetical protein CU097_006794 [Rhizopus azygosporus]|uniref:Mitochondrial import inner membrane translocase subunit TIM22 n=1 Tax=Rhizopus azygosporus TaxID=86630 RepID=A0A367J2E4_RHIAZ|nr:hypothetical protein CU097_006794 [Rhizopus azygosporus]CEG68309.1 hypothetical protein RMATCC62417_04602 [Rhizopus microsporus]CEI88411.1 hypothetical protein RMCBS344292_02802 [Rhizopus microsporus]
MSAPPTPNTHIPSLDNNISFTTVPPIEEDVKENNNVDRSMLRAGLDKQSRIILMSTIGSLWGFGIGAFIGGRQSGLQYLAENAHKLPTTVQGWYFYHKTKNYKMMLGGVKKGIRYAGRTGGLCLLYGTLEAGLDEVKGQADVVNSVTAGVATGTIFSILSKLPKGSFRYSVLFGATFGLVAGGLTELHRYVSYVSEDEAYVPS